MACWFRRGGVVLTGNNAVDGIDAEGWGATERRNTTVNDSDGLPGLRLGHFDGR